MASSAEAKDAESCTCGSPIKLFMIVGFQVEIFFQIFIIKICTWVVVVGISGHLHA